ncbi:hypothetical protein MNBD_ALPHA04-2336 [hydrothermal vent metagenome]|uniref:Type II secretion system protein H n=1 Tax=hydrothermal vent metagenome TaxID=652676 RepID=A0A3B0SEL3_9ZZZZ
MKFRAKFLLSKKETGFTLVELMVVLVIIGIMASVVILSFPDGNRELDQDAYRFAARTAALRDNAILQSRPMAVQVTASGYSFMQRSKGSWNILEDKPFQSTNWSEGVAVKLDDGAAARISFESTGLPSDQVEITLKHKKLSRRIGVDPMGEIKVLEAGQ